MDAPENLDQFDDDADDELDMSEDEFDARMAACEPVMVVGYAARPQLRQRVEDYYTLQKSDSRTASMSAGRWAGGPQSMDDRLTAIPSAV